MTSPSEKEWTPEMEERALRLCREATPGPWHATIRQLAPGCDDRCYGIEAHVEQEEDGQRWFTLEKIVITDDGVYPPEIPDACFIAGARSLLPAALAEIRRLREERDEYAVRLRPGPSAADEADAARARRRRRR